jgi:hypothetical protein
MLALGDFGFFGKKKENGKKSYLSKRLVGSFFACSYVPLEPKIFPAWFRLWRDCRCHCWLDWWPEVAFAGDSSYF